MTILHNLTTSFPTLTFTRPEAKEMLERKPGAASCRRASSKGIHIHIDSNGSVLIHIDAYFLFHRLKLQYTSIYYNIMKSEICWKMLESWVSCLDMFGLRVSLLFQKTLTTGSPPGTAFCSALAGSRQITTAAQAAIANRAGNLTSTS